MYHFPFEKVDPAAHCYTLSEFSAESQWQFLIPLHLSRELAFVQQQLFQVQLAKILNCIYKFSSKLKENFTSWSAILSPFRNSTLFEYSAIISLLALL